MHACLSANRGYRVLLPVLLATTALSGVPAALAQSSGEGLETVIVTAQKREENLQKVPMNVQVLSTEVANRTKEYAVLKAMGAPPLFVHGIGAAQAVLLGLGGLLPALAIGGAVLWYIEFRTHLDTTPGLVLIEKMLAITFAAAICAAATVIARVQRADPAALY